MSHFASTPERSLGVFDPLIPFVTLLLEKTAVLPFAGD
jgi:hypothetical protein